MADGRKSVKARLVATGYQEPDPQGGVADTSGCVSLRTSHPQVISLCAIKKRELRSLNFKNTFSRADGCTQEVALQAPSDWGTLRGDRVWKLKAPAFGLSEAPAAFRRSLGRRFLNSDGSLQRVKFRCQVSTFRPSHYFSEDQMCG